ncbi:bifunctional metallophosphatase/5'-nucleotidase [Cohnella hongkongensis]|uniref:Bifunctional metallophosphatase/5'-nucleotidase n=1 Tax=Cohnella hongkongensis TaxID=178337 RepID=A0ABV9FGX1_9BACL
MNKVTVTLLHTNDLHSHLEETSKIAGYVAEVRARTDPNALIVVDSGDFLDRARLETEGTMAAVNRAAMEQIGYDAVLLGNNEGLSYTPDELERIFGGMFIPFVCANMTLSETGRPPSWMVPSLILERAGLRIGLIGLTAPFTDYYRLLGWEAGDPAAALRAEVERLKPETDAIVLLSHLGLGNDERIAASVQGVDLILGGHTHHLLEVPLIVSDVAIGAAGKFGAYIGHLELDFGADRKLVRVSGGCLPTEGMTPSADMERLVAAHREQAKSRMGRRLARLREPLPWRHDRESPLPTLLASAIRSMTGAEIALVNAGQLLEGLPAGDVTEEKIHAICPSPINPCVMRLPGRLLLKSLEECLLPEFQDLDIRGFGFRGRVLGTLCLDGMEVRADLRRPPYDRILDVRIGGAALDERREYTVATLDMFTFGVGYVALKEGRDVRYYLPEFIRDVLARSLNDDGLVARSKEPRWRYSAAP